MPAHSYTYSYLHTHTIRSLPRIQNSHAFIHMCTHTHTTHMHAHHSRHSHILTTDPSPLPPDTTPRPQPLHTPGLYPFSINLFSSSVNILEKWKVSSRFPSRKRNVLSLCSQADGVLLGASFGAEALNSPLQWRGVPFTGFPSIDQS